MWIGTFLMVSKTSGVETVARLVACAAAVWVCLGSIAAWDLCPVARAQGRNERAAQGVPFDFDRFFDQMFGQQTEEQKRALEKVEVSVQDEQQFGHQARDQFLADLERRNIRVLSRGKEIQHLQKLVALIRPQMRHADRYRSITVLVAETPDTDARCFPGGTLVLFRGMLDAVPSEDALVAVIGHELSHIDHGHQLRYLKSMKLAQQTFSSGAPPDFRSMMNNTMLFTSIFARPFRPEDETEADLDGATWAYRAGYDPRELAKLFLVFEKRSKGNDAWMPAFFRTHPYNHQRYEAVLQRYEELQRTERRAK
jgi:predicted Zn-dependent protease